MSNRIGLLSLLFALVGPATVGAQDLRPTTGVLVEAVHRDLGGARATFSEQTSGARPLGNAKDYRWEGFVVGGVAFGAVGAVIAHSLCSNSDVANPGSCTGRTFAGGIVGGLLGVGVGTLLGSIIKKEP